MSASNEISTSIPVTGLNRVWVGFGTVQQGIASKQFVASAATAKALVTLIKPEITFMVMISAGVSCLMASNSLNLIVLTNTIFGTGLVAAGAATLNQFTERVLDGTMRRTARRPLPAGMLTPHAALIFGILLSVAGTIYLILFLNLLTALLGLLTLLSYLFIYTPLKRKTRWCTLVGAIPGAAPAFMGWAAVQNNLGLEACALFAILFLWQFPHFYAISWLYREDYARAGMLMLPAVDDDDGGTTFLYISFSAQLLIVVTAALTFILHMGLRYFLLAMILGFSFSYTADRASVSRSKAAAKKLVHASVIYLPLLYLAMLLDKFK